MDSRYALVIAMLCFCGNSAASQTIVCEAPQGTRVDYFSANRINLQNETFLMSKDRISSIKPTIELGDNQEVHFSLGNGEQMTAGTKSGSLKVLKYDAKQISFAGLVNGSPIMATYYPATSTLVYSQQSIWPGPDYEGVRAILFFSKCRNS